MNPDGSFNCPDIRTKANTTLRQTQLVLTRMLRLFDLVAKKHGIRYWLHSGTLIGAARHNGSLPWEYDADIEMPLTDYIQFFRHWYKELPDDIFFQNLKSDPYHRPVDQTKVAPPHHEVGYLRTPYNPRLRDKNSCYKYCIELGCKWHDGLQVDIFILESDTTAEFPLQEMTFEGFRFPVSKNWLEKLESKFGSGIMELPYIWHRKPKVWPDPLHSCEKLVNKQATRLIFKLFEAFMVCFLIYGCIYVGLWLKRRTKRKPAQGNTSRIRITHERTNE